MASCEVFRSDVAKHEGIVMLKILTITAASLAMLSAAAAADLPRTGAAAAGSSGWQGSDRQVSGRQGSRSASIRQPVAARG